MPEQDPETGAPERKRQKTDAQPVLPRPKLGDIMDMMLPSRPAPIERSQSAPVEAYNKLHGVPYHMIRKARAMFGGASAFSDQVHCNAQSICVDIHERTSTSTQTTTANTHTHHTHTKKQTRTHTHTHRW